MAGTQPRVSIRSRSGDQEWGSAFAFGIKTFKLYNGLSGDDGATSPGSRFEKH